MFNVCEAKCARASCWAGTSWCANRLLFVLLLGRDGIGVREGTARERAWQEGGGVRTLSPPGPLLSLPKKYATGPKNGGKGEVDHDSPTSTLWQYLVSPGPYFLPVSFAGKPRRGKTFSREEKWEKSVYRLKERVVVCCCWTRDLGFDSPLYEAKRVAALADAETQRPVAPVSGGVDRSHAGHQEGVPFAWGR